MNTAGILYILVPSIISLILAFTVYHQNPKNPLNRILGYLCGVNFLYQFVLFLVNNSGSLEQASFFLKFNFVWALTGFVGVYLIYEYLEKTFVFPKKIAVSFLLAISLLQFIWQVFFVDQLLDLEYVEGYGWDLVSISGFYTIVSTTALLFFLFYLSLEVVVSILKKEVSYEVIRLAVTFLFMMVGIFLVVLVRDVLLVFNSGHISGVVLLDMVVSITALYTVLNQNVLNFDLKVVSEEVVKAMSNFVFLVNRKGEIVESNSAGCELLGFSCSELENQAFSRILPDFEERANASCGSFFELDMFTKNGRLLPVMVSITKVHRKNTFLGYVITGSDLTEVQNSKLKLESYVHQLEAKNRLLKDFNYLLSHDLKEPLRSMGAFSSLLNDRYAHRLDKKAREYLGFITAGANRITQLINGLTEIINLDKTPVRKDRVLLTEVLDIACDNLRQLIKETNATVRKSNLCDSIYVDPIQFSQVLQNLLINAIRYSRPGCDPVVEITLSPGKGDQILSVKDNGKGIENNLLEKVFNLFYRGAKDRKGSGIGLSICRRIVENHQGDIWVESQPGEGSVFYIRLPKYQEQGMQIVN